MLEACQEAGPLPTLGCFANTCTHGATQSHPRKLRHNSRLLRVEDGQTRSADAGLTTSLMLGSETRERGRSASLRGQQAVTVAFAWISLGSAPSMGNKPETTPTARAITTAVACTISLERNNVDQDPKGRGKTT